MTVDARHLNFNGGCHGGAIFSLADCGVRPGVELARAARLRDRRAHHLPGRRRAPATRWSRAPSKCSAAAASASTGSTSSAQRRGGGETAVSSFTGTVYDQGLSSRLARRRTGIHPRVLSRSLSCGTTTWRQNFPRVALHRSGPGAAAFVANASTVQTDLSPPPARARRRAARRRRRCARRNSASGRRSAGATSRALVRALACGLAEAGLQRGEHLVVIGENRPRLYAAMLAAQSLGAIPVPLYQDAAAAEFVFPIGNAEVALRDRRGPGAGRQAARGARRSARSSRASGTTTRAACATTTSPGWRRSMRWSRPAAPATRSIRGFFDAEVAQGAGPTTSRRCSSPRAPPATRRAWCTPTPR